MDQNIYAPTRKEYGIYATRRYPRGGAGGVLTPLPVGGIQSELNPTPIVLGFATSAIAPHAETERFRYVVPPKRRLKVQTAIARALRTLAAAPADQSAAFAAVIRSNNSIVQNFAMAWFFNATQGFMQQDNNNGEQEFFEGDIIVGRSFDLSTGGTIRFDVQIVAVEYDAFFKSQSAVSAGSFDGAGNPISAPSSVPQQSIRPGYLGSCGVNCGLPI